MNTRRKKPLGQPLPLSAPPAWCRLCATALVAAMPLMTSVTATTQVWVPGSVTWDNIAPNWDTGQWTNGNDAIFDLGTGIVTIGPSGVEASSILFNSSSAITGGNLTISGGATLDAASGEVATIQSNIIGSAGLTVGQRGSGNIILLGSNSFTGATRVTGNSWLGVQSNAALGSTTGGTEVEAGSTLSLGDVIISGETLTIAGQGRPGSDGALHVNGIITTATVSGPVSLSADATIGSAGRLVLNGLLDTTDQTLTVNATPTGLIEINGAISGNVNDFNDNILLTGGGSIELNAANSQSGTTTITGGTTVTASQANALPTVNGRTALSIDETGTGSSSLDISTTSQAVASLAGGPSATVNLGAGGLTIGHGSGVNLNGSNNSDFGGTIRGLGGITKDDLSTQEFSGENDYEGATNINGGVLRIRNALGLGTSDRGTTVTEGASLIVDGVTIAGEQLSIAGNGAAGIEGALSDGGSSASFNGTIDVSDDATVRSNETGNLSLGGIITTRDVALSLDAAGTININNLITGNSSNFDDDVTISGGGTVNLNSSTTYLGATSIIEGTTLNTNTANALPTLSGRTSLFMDLSGPGGSILDISGASQAIASLNGAPSSNILLGGNTLTVGFGSGANTNGSASANFEGVISGIGTVIKDDISTQILSGENTFEGLTNVNSGTLTIASDSALGATSSPDSLTSVLGGARLALQGDITTGERIILYNNAELSNNSGANSLNNLLLIEHDVNGPYAGQKHAHIGALNGQLNLNGGIDDLAGRFSSNPEMNVALNTGEDDNGILYINSVIGTSIRDAAIGRASNSDASTGTVILGGNNQQSGATYLNGGPVQLGIDGSNSRAFGDSAVTVNNTNFLIGADDPVSGAQILNHINISAGSTLNTQDNLGLGGPLSGAGSLSANSGTLTLFGDSNPTWQGTTTVDSGATLTTLNPELISDSSALTVNGTVSLGGNETIGDLSGAGTITNNGNDLAVTQTSDQTFSGTLSGAGGLTKQGEATLTLSNGSSFTGDANVNEGTLTVSGALATNTINVANEATLTTTAADLLSSAATVTNDGTVTLGGDQTLTSLIGASTGVVNIGANNLILTGGANFQGRISGTNGTVSAGPGDLILGGDNTFTGLLTILDGSTTILDGSVDGNITVDTGAELVLGSAERIADGADLTVDGILNTNGEETVNALTATGTINGAGTVSALTTSLTDATVQANLGDGALTSNGTTTLNGSANADSLTVENGTLTVNGALTNNSATVTVENGTLAANGTIAAASIDVAEGATLTTEDAERLNNGVALTNDGTVSLGGNETIGDLSGAGTITNNGNGLTVNQTSDTAFTGNITGAGGLTKQGEAGLTLTNGSDFTGDANINAGTLTVSGVLATNTINVANGATLTTTAADLLSDGATLTNDGTLNLGGNDTLTNLFGSDTGVVNLAGNNLLLLGGVDFQGRINGDGGTVSTGPGDIILGGDNTFTGDLTVLSGSTTTLTGSADGDVTIAAGGELTLGSAERIADSVTLTIVTGDGADPSGILNLNGTERVTTLQSGGIIRGPGLINAETYNLTDGAITEEGADLGNGILNSDGTVLLGGDSFAGTVNVRSGTMTLNGSVIHEPALTVNVNQGATLALGFDERIGDNAVANINGTLTLNGTETVTTFNLNGTGSTLNGTGLVLAETYNLANGATTEEGANLGSGILNSDGNAVVTLNGDSAAEAANIISGTFNLNGQLTDALDLTISGGATVNLGSNERINDPSAVTVLQDGTLNLNGTETIRSYNSNGNLGLSPGAIEGTLVITESPINLMDGHVSLNGTNLENLSGETPQLTSNGNVLISGTSDDTAPGPNNATINVNTLDVQTGTLTLNGLLTNPDGEINIHAGATLVSGSSNRVNGDSSTLNLENRGTWTLGGDDTVGTFNSSGLLNGSGTLTSLTYNLSNGAETEIGANLGTGVLNSGPGSVTLEGNAAVEAANVNSGILNLDGQLTSVETLNVADGGILVSGSANRINDTANANITTGGTWTLNGDDTIGALNSSGLLNGTGTLTAETYNLTDGAVTEVLANLGNGTLNSDGGVILNGDAAVETANVSSGTLTLNGQLTDVTNLNISGGGTLASGGAERIHDDAMTNIATGGTMTLNGEETIATLNSGGLLNGNGTLTAAIYNLTDGAVTETLANLGTGTLNSDGTVILNGDASAETTNVNTGTLNLNGQLTGVTELNISQGATLANGSAERINDASVVNNTGTMTLSGDESVTTVNADGGLLNGSGLLTAETYNLSNGAATTTGADLGAGTLNTGPGAVTLDGNTAADAINVQRGSLITNGGVQNPGGVITVASDALWRVNGSHTYSMLRGEGTVQPSGLNGDTFRNENTISPGSELGTLIIAGDYIESGIYHAQLDQAPVSDTLQVTGNVTLGNDSGLDLSEFGGLINGSGAVLCGQRWNIIDTPNVINGGWGEISDANNPGALGQTFQSQLLFDRGTGDLVSLGLQAGQSVADYVGISTDQASILSAILEGATGDDLIVGNFNSQDGASGTLLNTVYTQAQPGDKTGLYSAINSLSPEAFAGAVDYALVATRGYVESALGYRPRSREDLIIISEDDKGGSIATPFFRSEENIETFAGFSNVQVGSSSSQSGNDYSLQSSGIYAGGRLLATDKLVLSSYIAADVGSISSSTIDLDTHGLIVGASFDYAPVDPDHPLRIIGTASYANYEYDGHRRSVADRYQIPEIDANAFEAGIRVEYGLINNEGWSIIPAIGLRHLSAHTDAFSELGGPGALFIGEHEDAASLVDLGVFANYQQFGKPYGFNAELRWQHDFADAHRDIDAVFAASGTAFDVTSPGMGSDALIFSLGSYYDVDERYRIGFNYRGERRSNADMLHSFNLRIMAGF